jgi:hypothetical protein
MFENCFTFSALEMMRLLILLWIYIKCYKLNVILIHSSDICILHGNEFKIKTYSLKFL